MSFKSLIASVARRAPGKRPDAAQVCAVAGGADVLRDDTLHHGLDAQRAQAMADALESEDRLLEALDALVIANQLRRDPAIERRLVRLRRAAYRQLDFSLVPPTWPHFALAAAPERRDGPLEINAGQFDAAALKTGVLHHGHLLVRGLVPPARAARLREVVDRAFDARDRVEAGETSPETAQWFDPLEGIPDGGIHREVARQAFGAFAADSPRALYEYVQTLRDLQLDRMIWSYFGERPALSVRKCTLRRVDQPVKVAGWHQDGAFLGTAVRSLNAWMALSRCGREAPSLELIPRRLDRIIPQLNDGSPFAWTVPPEHIARELPGVEVWKPELEPGDVLFFDHWSLHRTAIFETTPARPRHAIEGWFFAPSAYVNDPSELLVL